MLKIDDAQLVIVGDKKVVRCDVCVTEVEFFFGEVDPCLLFHPF